MKNTTSKILLTLVSTACIGIQAVAETNANPFNGYALTFGQNMPAPALGAALIDQVDPNNPNMIAAPIFNNLRQDENQVVYDQTNAVSGREYKTNDAEKQGNAGTVAAIITGSALVGTGTPMLFSPILPVVIAGAQLIAMGGMEFAQAGADGGSAANNKAQTDTLMNNPSAGGPLPNANMRQSIKDKLNTPELNETLTKNGINAEEFIENLSAGNFSSPQDVLAAIGNNSDFSAEDFAKGQQIASQEFGKIGGELGTARLQSEENAESVSGGGFGGTLSGGAAGTPGTTDSGITSVAVGKGGSTSGASGRGLASSFGGVAGADGVETNGAGLNPQAIVNGIFNKDKDQAAAAAAFFSDSVIRQTYLKAGVQRPIKGQSIFTMAKRTFRSFHKYRKAAKGVKHASR